MLSVLRTRSSRPRQHSAPPHLEAHVPARIRPLATHSNPEGLDAHARVRAQSTLHLGA
jgi:hypothetical protein